MDTKQIQVNTFTDGLNTDLHPLTTPNTILTDCINGTIITYNGNEYILQNDMGNYQLKNAVLTPNYIPIGIKEYAGIIYIVSYNPIDKLTEIGSYPSPQTIFDSEKNNSREANYIQLVDEYSKYTELTKQQAIQLYSTEENFILNPGDKYYVYLKLDENKIYQTIEFYILSKEKNLFPLDYTQINVHSEDNPDRIDYSAVTWEIPGWLAYKFRIANLDQFNLYLTKLQQPGFTINDENVNLDYTVIAQAITSDLLFDNTELLNKLKVWIAVGYINENGDKIYIFNGNTKKITVNNNDFDDKKEYGLICDIKDITYTSINKFLFTEDINPNTSEKYKALTLSINSDTKNVFIEAIPLIQNAEDNKHIIYDNFETVLTVNLDNIKDISTINVFDTYKYLIANDSITLNFNITSSLTSIYNLGTEIRIYKITNRDEQSYNLKLALAEKLTEVNYLGQNIITFSFSSDSKRNSEFENESIEEFFEKEQIYLLELRIYIDNDRYKKYYKLLITSELFNSFYNKIDDFSTINLSEWTAQLSNYVEIPNVKLVNKGITENDYRLYRNNSKDTERIFRLRTDEGGENWQNNYNITVENNQDMSIDDYPAAGVEASDTVTITNYIPTIFNNIGIWKDYSNDLSNWNFTFTVNTDSGQKLVFTEQLNLSQLSQTINLYKYYRLNMLSQNRKEANWDRFYIYDCAQTSLYSFKDDDDRTIIRNKQLDITKTNPGTNYWGTQQYSNQDGARVNIARRKQLKINNSELPELENVTLQTSPEKGFNGAGSKDGWYDWWTNYGKIISPFMIIEFNAQNEAFEQYFRIRQYDITKKHKILAIRIATKISDTYAWCVIPMYGGTLTLVAGETSSDALITRLLQIINQVSIHVFTYITPKSGNITHTFNLLIPNYISVHEKLSETLTTGMYKWNFLNINWNGRKITENNVNYNNLYLNDELIDINETEFNTINLKSESIEVSKDKTSTINLYIANDLTQFFEYSDNYSGGEKNTSIENINIDINNFLYTLQTLSTNRQNEINVNNSIQEGTVAHDLKELSINISDTVLNSFETFISKLKTEKVTVNLSDNTNVEAFKFYSTYANSLGQVIGYVGDEQSDANHGYYLPPTSELQLPLIEDTTLWNNVSEKFKFPNV